MLFLNAELTRQAAWIDAHTGHLPAWDGYGFRWIVCPNCFWVSAVFIGSAQEPKELARCPRPGDQIFDITRIFGKGKCSEARFLDELAPRVADALSAVLRLGGTNAVIYHLEKFLPIELGLDHKAIGIHGPLPFEELRPESVRKK